MSSTSGRYHSTYTPPWSAYQNCTPMTTAADWAMTWARFRGVGQNMVRTMKAMYAMNTGSR